MTTEIYICKDGQELKQGKLVYSEDVDDRESAEDDAKHRCKTDQTIKKIAYYKVSSSGDFRVFFSYTNPDCKPAPKPRPASAAPVRRPAAQKKKPPPPPSIMQRLKKMFGL